MEKKEISTYEDYLNAPIGSVAVMVSNGSAIVKVEEDYWIHLDGAPAVYPRASYSKPVSRMLVSEENISSYLK